METWSELAAANLSAAKDLLDGKHYRSSVSRAYYAAFSAITAKALERGVQFPHGGNNPTHDQLFVIVRHNLDLTISQRREAMAVLRRLRHERVVADYVPGDTVDGVSARSAVRDAIRTLDIVEVSVDE